MICKRIFSLIACTLILTKSYAQVNLQTGSATFSLPMFNWQDDQSRLRSVVALNYNSGSGLKVDEVASNIGQGWSLVAGGVITRLQVGEPDDQMAYPQSSNGSELDLNRYPNGYLYANVPATNGCPVALTKYPIYKSKNQLYAQNNPVAEDKQLDYFSFQFNGKAGLFVLDANGDKGVSLGDSKMKITFQRDVSVITNDAAGIRTTISSFTIQDVDGLTYKFTKKGLTKVLKSEYCDPTATQTLKTPKFENDHVYYQSGFDEISKNPWVVNSWALTEIDDAFTNRKVLFNYNTLNVDTKAGQEIAFNDAKNHYCIVTFRRSITKTPELSSIVYPDGHNVNFNYATSSRIDVNGEYALAAVDITYNGRYLSKYKLNTSYFIQNRYGTPTSNFQKRVARLCLKSVQKFGVDLKEDTPPYLFDYYLGSDAAGDFVPPPFFYQKDVWGFYNGANKASDGVTDIPLNVTVTELDANMLKGLCHLVQNGSGYNFNYFTAKSGYAKNGLLKQIIYPTGGTLTYDYAQNTGLLNGGAQQLCGVHVSKTSSTDGGYSNGCSNPVSTSYNYILPDGSSSLWGLEMPVSYMTTSNHYQPEGKYYHWTWSSMPLGECTWHYQYPGILSQNQAIDLPIWINIMNSMAPALGILNVISTVKDAVTAFSGGSPVALIIDLALDLFQIGFTCFSSNEQNYSITAYYNFDFNSGNSLPTQFKRVEIVENPGTIGKTVQTFTSKDDYALWVPEGKLTDSAFSSCQRFAPWAYGLPSVTTVFDSLGNKVKETQNVYNFQTYWQAKCASNRYDRTRLLKQPLNKVSAKCLVKFNTSQNNDDWADYAVYSTGYQTGTNSQIGVNIYDLYTGRTELDTVYQRVYKNNDPSQYVETVTGYVYNDDNYEPSFIRTIGSDGRTTQKNIYYTIDYVKTYTNCYTASSQTTSNPEIIALVNKNIISLPVETNEMLPAGSSSQYLYDKATLFTTLTNGDIKPSNLLEGRFAQPTSRTSPWPSEDNSMTIYKPGALLDPASPDYSFFKVAQTFTYAATGEPISVKDEGNRTVSSIYGYNNKYVTASAVNAKPNEIYFGDFEQNGWDGVNPIASTLTSYDNTKAHSGQYSGRIDNSGPGEKVVHADQWLSISLTEPTKFKYSGWIYSTGPSAEIFLFMKTATEQNYYTYVTSVLTTETNKWVYVEGEYTVPATITKLNIRIDNNSAGSVWFDDIRLHPSAARMTTYTYDPLIGKTSESDVNSRVTYYEYDNLGRLQFIKDEKRNIVKMYEYNNVSKQNGCPGTYYNHSISETFTKNNCSAGYLGSDVTFTVAADTYSSAISQADADAQAENYVLANGQAYANANGSCRLIYYNVEKSQIFTTENCSPGYKGGTVTYTVPENRYSSIVSQSDADQKALDEIAANGYAYANDPAHAVCVVDTSANYEWLSGAQTRCANINGQLPPHLFVLATDVNPNSPTYNQTMWEDAGTSTACPSSNYYSTDQSGDYYSQNCPSGQTPEPIYVSMPPGSYSSTVSLAEANNIARQAAQDYANLYGGCASVPITIDYTSGNVADYVAIEFHNVSDYNDAYYFDAAPNTSDYLGTVSAGTYNITFIPYDDYHYHDYSVCDDTYYDNFGQFDWPNSVLINSGCSTINIGGEYW